jgi:hypothetical protein
MSGTWWSTRAWRERRYQKAEAERIAADFDAGRPCHGIDVRLPPPKLAPVHQLNNAQADRLAAAVAEHRAANMVRPFDLRPGDIIRHDGRLHLVTGRPHPTRDYRGIIRHEIATVTDVAATSTRSGTRWVTWSDMEARTASVELVTLHKQDVTG